MIDKNRPVCGADMERLRQKLGVTVEDMCYMIGISMPRWGLLVRRNGDKPLRDVTTSLIVRYIDKHIDDSYLPKMPTPHDLFERMESDQVVINALGSVNMKTISVMLGRESTSGHRWLVTGRGPSPSILRASLVISNILSGSNPEIGLQEWLGVINEEARARGVSDIWKAGKWTAGGTRTPKKKETDPK